MTIRHTRLATLAVLGTVLLLGGCGKSASEKSSKTDSDKSGSKTKSQTGDGKKMLTQATKLPPVAVPDSVLMVDTKPEQLKEFIAQHKGNAVLVDYWATWCGPCKKAFPHTVKLSKEYADKGLVVISVSMDDHEKRADALKFLKAMDAKFINFFSSDEIDPDNRTELFGVKGMPCYKIYKPDGTLLNVFANGEPQDKIDAAVHEALGLK